MSCCRVVVRQDVRRVCVRQDVRSVRVASPGPQGAQGPPGVAFTGAYVEGVNGRSGQVTLGVSDVRNVASGRLLGRRSGSAGNAEEITLGTGLKMSSTGQLTTNLLQVAGADVKVVAGTGLVGGGDLTADRSFAVDFAPSGLSVPLKAVRADDPRLGDARPPVAHAHAITDVADISLSSPAPGDVLAFDASVQRWTNSAVSDGGNF
jgi:hypothetical protein